MNDERTPIQFIIQRSAFHVYAFSLIELMLVVAIIATVAAIAAPRYAGAVNRYRADTAARRIAADFSMAQSRARSLSATRTLTFNATNSTYQISGETDLNHSGSAYNVDLTVRPYHASIASLSFGGTTVTGSGTGSVSFNGFGIPSSAGTVTILVGSERRQVWIDADVGTATVQ